jgi:malate dehydrogenase (oxaloacetate-decarboxylating)(NADP+)
VLLAASDTNATHQMPFFAIRQGLGDLGGPNGHGIPVGKLLLYTACGGIHPSRTLPVSLDTGCNVELYREAPDYTGLRIERVRGQAYDDFVEEFMSSAGEVFGTDCLIQHEDFANANASRLLTKYRNRGLLFNDDM